MPTDGKQRIYSVLKSGTFLQRLSLTTLQCYILKFPAYRKQLLILSGYISFTVYPVLCRIFEYVLTISYITCYPCTGSSEYETLLGSWHAVEQLCHCDAMSPQLEKNSESGYWWYLACSSTGVGVCEVPNLVAWRLNHLADTWARSVCVEISINQLLLWLQRAAQTAKAVSWTKTLLSSDCSWWTVLMRRFSKKRDV